MDLSERDDLRPNFSKGLLGQKVPVRVPLAVLTARIIQNEAAAGRWATGLPGERSLAKELQVSRSTLREALGILERNKAIFRENGKRKFHTGTPSINGHHSSDVVAALYWSDSHRLSITGMVDLEELHSTLYAAGLHLEIVTQSSCGSEQRLFSQLQQHHERIQPCCWILLSCPPEVHLWFQEKKLPAIVSGSRRTDISLPSVGTDNFAVARHATGRMLALGHRRLGMLVPNRNVQGDREAERGFRVACQQSSAVDIDNQVFRHNSSVKNISTSLEKFLKEDTLPAALVVTHYCHAITALTWLLSNGYKVPEDVSLISLYSQQALEYTVPAISCYDNPDKQLALRLAKKAIRYARTGYLSDKSVKLLSDELPGATLAPGPATRNIQLIKV